MSLVKLDKVKKYYGDRLILDINKLEILEGEKIGIVGENGAGKTTLIKIILGQIEPDEGQVFLTKSYSYISQTENYLGNCTEGKLKKILEVPEKYSDFLSGGEKVKLKINEALSKNSSILIADEPTSNLDSESIENFKKIVSNYKGSILLISHDRNILDNLCNRILEIDKGKVQLYKGNYSKYIELKAEENARTQTEHYEYISEKRRLENAILVKQGLRDSIRKAPRRMGNSEARLIRKMGNQKAKKNIDGSIKALKSRIEHLQVKEKPKASKETKIRIQNNCEMISKTVLAVTGLSIFVESKLLIKDVEFKIEKGRKVALIGKNGCGKSTLIKKILEANSENIRFSKYISIGYFDQRQDIVNDSKTILENIKEDSSYEESFIRINLDGFGFRGDDVYKKVSTLSGGEKVKVALCKIILADNNTLILDEPTNYLDIKAIEALEKALINTEKTVLIVSHDRQFIANICNYILEIKDKSLITFNGSFDEFENQKLNKRNPQLETKSKKIKEERLLILENKLSEIISTISIEKDISKKENLNKEYLELIEKIKEMKN